VGGGWGGGGMCNRGGDVENYIHVVKLFYAFSKELVAGRGKNYGRKREYNVSFVAIFKGRVTTV